MASQRRFRPSLNCFGHTWERSPSWGFRPVPIDFLYFEWIYVSSSYTFCPKCERHPVLYMTRCIHRLKISYYSIGRCFRGQSTKGNILRTDVYAYCVSWEELWLINSSYFDYNPSLEQEEPITSPVSSASVRARQAATARRIRQVFLLLRIISATVVEINVLIVFIYFSRCKINHFPLINSAVPLKPLWTPTKSCQLADNTVSLLHTTLTRTWSSLRLVFW